MKFNHPIQVDFYEFLKNGKFDYLKLGQSKEWILTNFPDPDQHSEAPTHLSGPEAWMHPRCILWKYGDIEFLFNEQNELCMIYCDGFNWENDNRWCSKEIDGGSSLLLNKWIFENVEKLTLLYVIEALLLNGMHFKTSPFLSQGIEVTIQESNVVLHFEPFWEDTECTIKNYRCISFRLAEV